MTDNGTTATTQPEENPAVSRQHEPDTPEPAQPPEPPEPIEPAEPAETAVPVEPAEDPGYLTRTGEAVGEDGSVVPIIGGLPAVEGSAWDVGAPVDDRGVDLADEQEIPPERLRFSAAAAATRARIARHCGGARDLRPAPPRPATCAASAGSSRMLVQGPATNGADR